MAFPLKDVRYTTRRRRGEDGAGAVAETKALYPRLFRDRSILPKVTIAVEYFESLVGRERQDFDPEVLVQFFGDHKLARCIVGALATSYRYRSPQFADITSRTALRRLRRAGVDGPKSLRAHLYQRLNRTADGFMRQDEQRPLYGSMEEGFGLPAGQVERLLYLDAGEHAILTRIGGRPQPADVVAQYNFGVLETLLRHAESVELTLADVGNGGPGSSPATSSIRGLCAANEVDATLTAAGAGRLRLRLAGRRDALGGLGRHGRRVARTVVQLLERALPASVEGVATVSLRDRRATLRLTPEALDVLGGAVAGLDSRNGSASYRAGSLPPGPQAGPAPSAGWDDLPGWDVATVAAGILAARGAGRAPNGGPPGRAWGLRRLPEAQAWASGIIVPDVRLVWGTRGVRVCAVRSARHGARLAAIAPYATSGEPLLYTGHPLAVEPLVGAGQRVVATPVFDLRPVIQALAGEGLEELDTAGGAGGTAGGAPAIQPRPPRRGHDASSRVVPGDLRRQSATAPAARRASSAS